MSKMSQLPPPKCLNLLFVYYEMGEKFVQEVLSAANVFYSRLYRWYKLDFHP